MPGSGRSLTLRELVAPDWYWYSGPAAYNQGAPLVNYLLRVYGPERSLKLYTTCQQATFEADCRATLGIGLDELDAAFWADTERIARRAGPLARIWLKSLKLGPGVDRAAWDAFVADYFAAAGRLLAPYEHIRLATVHHLECRFGPIPESEFAPESFLRRLEPDGIVRKRVEGPSTATPVDRYWLAFVGGGISLAGGSGLALGSRRRDRRALRAG